MRWNCWIAVALLVSLSACKTRRASPPAQTFPGASGKSRQISHPDGTIVTPAQPKVGRISLVNPSGRYVIVTYAVGVLPARESRLNVYRGGLKVAELRVTDFSRDLNAAADIVAGECQVGDEVREN
jgi:hypothetical protein